jgi:hypothetical protein
MNNSMNRFGEADRLARQPLDPRVQPQVFALNLLRMSLARMVLIRVDMTRISTPIIRMIRRDAEGLQQPFQPQAF